MCGIVGFINLSEGGSIRAEGVFKQLLFHNQARGRDATGVATMNLKGETDWIKTATDPDGFFANKDVEAFFRRYNGSGFTIGHNRAKTIGANTCDNAHPFSAGHILGVHNGTLRNKYELCKEGYKYDVDSHALMAGISENGIEETIGRADGAFSIVYINDKNRTLNFVRNDERPMHIIEAVETQQGSLPDRHFLFFGSEVMMLYWILSRNGFRLGKHFETVPYEHLSFKLGNAKPTVKKLAKFEKKQTYVPPVSSGRGGHQTWRERESEALMGKKKAQQALILTNQTKPVSAPVQSSTASTGQEEEIPFEMRKVTFLQDPSVNTQLKRHFVRIYRQTRVGDQVNFYVEDMVDLKNHMQLIGRLAGKKKAGFPVIVSTIMPLEEAMKLKKSDILSGTLRHKGINTGGKEFDFIVEDAKVMFTGVTNFEEISC